LLILLSLLSAQSVAPGFMARSIIGLFKNDYELLSMADKVRAEFQKIKKARSELMPKIEAKSSVSSASKTNQEQDKSEKFQIIPHKNQETTSVVGIELRQSIFRGGQLLNNLKKVNANLLCRAL